MRSRYITLEDLTYTNFDQPTQLVPAPVVIECLVEYNVVHPETLPLQYSWRFPQNALKVEIKEFTSGIENIAELPSNLKVGPTILFPPKQSITANGTVRTSQKYKMTCLTALMLAIQELLVAVERQERRKRKKTRKGKKQEPDIEPFGYIAEHLMREIINTYSCKWT